MSAITPTILCDGEALDPDVHVISIEVQREIGRIPWAEMRLADGNAAQQTFELAESEALAPGAPVEIEMRYDGEESSKSIFKGLVTRQSIESRGRGSCLVIELKDAAVCLTSNRRSAVFRDQADHEVMGALVSAADLEAGDFTETEPAHAELVQAACTDWDFMLYRAEALGLLLVVADGVVSAVAPDLSEDAQHQFEWGDGSILDFDLSLDGFNQPEAIESTAWNLEEQARTEPAEAEAFDLAQGDQDPEAVAESLGFETRKLHHPGSLSEEELAAWATGQLRRERLSMLRGRLAIIGSADYQLLDLLTIEGVGSRFAGKTLLSGIRHRLDSRGWRTDLQLGLRRGRLYERTDVTAPSAGGLVPAVNGLLIGVVEDFAEDPDGEFRVPVLLPSVDPEEGVVWARLASPAAGEGRGFFFRPDAGDEVVVGFLGGDPRYPMILGALFGSKNKPPEAFAELSAENAHKGVVSNQGATIAWLDEDKPALSLETPGENMLVLSDADEEIRLSDQHGNALVLGADGITLESAKDLMIKADGNIKAEGSKVDLL